MSYSKSVTLWCDSGTQEQACMRSLELTVGTVTLARRAAAKEEGWRYRYGLDLCPFHAGTQSAIVGEETE